MSRRTLQIWLIFCHVLDTFTITTFTRIYVFVNLRMDVQQGWISHCMIHREALVAKKISPSLHVVVQDAVKIINFIESRALNTRSFANLWGEMESELTLLLHCEVRWLSKTKALKRLLLLRNEVVIFLTEKNSNLVHHFAMTAGC